MPVQSGRGTADDLLVLQALAWSSLVLSVTRRCPLRCSHCITSSGPDVGGPTLTESLAVRWAAELPALANEGLRHLTFTGGEPTVAIGAVRRLALAARDAGLRTAIVTSGAWAATPAGARAVAMRLEAVSHWDLGYDAYHEPEMTWERFARAVEALDAAGASLSVRVCEGPDPAKGEALLARVAALVGPGRVIIRQRVRRLGRAEAPLPAPAGAPARLAQACPSSGAFVREDGRAGPCCSGLAYEGLAAHPLHYGDAHENGLRAVWYRWRDDQVLRAMRLAGLDVLRSWLEAEGVSTAGIGTDDACESCVAMWRRCTPDAAQRVRARALDPAVRAKLDELEQYLFGRIT